MDDADGGTGYNREEESCWKRASAAGGPSTSYDAIMGTSSLDGELMQVVKLWLKGSTRLF